MRHHPNNSVISADDTVIGYQTFGEGPGIILLHGAMQTASSFTKLALALADSFTVYVPDRRGRGLSGPIGQNYGMDKEIEDLAALIAKTGASNVFGLSSGALIALQAGLVLPAIKVALYEPPLVIAGAPSPMAWVPRYEREVAKGNLAAAMVAGMRGTGEKSLLLAMPDFVLVPLMRLALRKDAKKRSRNISLEALVRLVHFDAALASEMAGTLEKFRNLRVEVLLMGGGKSADFLKAALNSLERTLPQVRRVELPGTGHLGPLQEPEQVAHELKRFLTFSK